MSYTFLHSVTIICIGISQFNLIPLTRCGIEAFALLEVYPIHFGNCLLTFRDFLSAPSSAAKQPKLLAVFN